MPHAMVICRLNIDITRNRTYITARITNKRHSYRFEMKGIQYVRGRKVTIIALWGEVCTAKNEMSAPLVQWYPFYHNLQVSPKYSLFKTLFDDKIPINAIVSSIFNFDITA